MEGIDRIDDFEQDDREEIFSKTIRAGKRTYFIDVKATKKNDYYLTITESKKRYEENGRFYFEKHKLFLYKEDFEKFTEGLTDALNYINQSEDDLSFEKKDSVDYNSSESKNAEE